MVTHRSTILSCRSTPLILKTARSLRKIGPCRTIDSASNRHQLMSTSQPTPSCKARCLAEGARGGRLVPERSGGMREPAGFLPGGKVGQAGLETRFGRFVAPRDPAGGAAPHRVHHWRGPRRRYDRAYSSLAGPQRRPAAPGSSSRPLPASAFLAPAPRSKELPARGSRKAATVNLG